MCQTIYPSREGITHQNVIALSIMNIVSSIVNISINIFLVYGLWKLNLIKNISYKFIVFLCIADGCVGLVTQPAVSILLLTDNIGNKCIHEIATYALQIAFSQFSILMILIITVDRFLRMTYLTRYKNMMTQKRGSVLIITSIFITFIIVLLNITASIYDFLFAMHTATMAINTIFFIIILIIYSKTYTAIRNRVNHSHLNTTTHPHRNVGSIINRIESIRTSRCKIQYHQNFGKAMIFVLLAIGVCYLPYFVFLTYLLYLRLNNKVNISNGDWKIAVFYWLKQLTFVNSTANALIVILSNNQLRKFTKRCSKLERNPNATIPDRQQTNSQAIPRQSAMFP